MVKSKNQKRNTKKIQYTRGAPTRNNKGALGFANIEQDAAQVHSLANPFCQEARGSKLPDSDSSKSVAISLVTRKHISTDTNGLTAIRIKPSLAETYSVASTITGSVITTLASATAIADNTALAAQFGDYRIVSWGVKIFSTVAPTDQSGHFSMITNPSFTNGADTASSFFEETLAFPTTETTVQWISKPVGNSYLDYQDITSECSWDHLLIYGSGLPASTTAVFSIEVFFNLECQVKLGAISAAIATPAADHKPHILTAVGHVAKKLAGSKLAQEAKQGVFGWIKNALGTVAKAGLSFIGQRYGVPAPVTQRLLQNF